MQEFFLKIKKKTETGCKVSVLVEPNNKKFFFKFLQLENEKFSKFSLNKLNDVICMFKKILNLF